MDPGGQNIKTSIKCIYQLFEKISCCADGSVTIDHVLDALNVNGRELIDFVVGKSVATGKFWWLPSHMEQAWRMDTSCQYLTQFLKNWRRCP